MTRFALALAFTALSAASAFADTPANCTPAQQNWVNASGFTCPVQDQNNENNDRNYRMEVEATAAAE